MTFSNTRTAPIWSLARASRAGAFLHGLLAGLIAWVQPALLPWIALIGLTLAGAVVASLYRQAQATALRPAILWLAISVCIAILLQIIDLRQLHTPEAATPPAQVLCGYLSVMAALAAFLSVYNARKPGNGAWAWLCLILLLSSLIPWMEQSGLVFRSRLPRAFHLEFPWNLFLGGLALVLVCNFLPTRLGLAAFAFLVAFATQVASWIFASGLALFPHPVRHWGWMLACAVLLIPAGLSPPHTNTSAPRTDRLWTWFRDRWGVVWALRIIPRFDREAQVHRLPLHLTWHGLEPAPDVKSITPEQDAAAMAILSALLHRFAEPDHLRSVAALLPPAETKSGAHTAVDPVPLTQTPAPP